MYSKQLSKKELCTDKVFSLFIFPRYSGSCPVILQLLSILKQNQIFYIELQNNNNN